MHYDFAGLDNRTNFHFMKISISLDGATVRQYVVLSIIVLGMLLRLAAISHWEADLTIDRDAYLGITQSLYEGRGFASQGETEPTAFRPPLYPMLLSYVYWLGPASAVATVNLLSSLLILCATSLVAHQLGLSRLAWLAVLLLAVDPLLVKYTSQPMTEVTSAALMITWVSSWLSWRQSLDWRWAMTTGIFFGLNVLCRPTILAAVPLLVIWTLACWVMRKKKRPNGLSVIAMAATLLVMMPWLIRNAVDFHKLIPATTHGGYTLLLANNESFYRASVEGDAWGKIWERLPNENPDSQASWYQKLTSEMDAQGLKTEIARDQYQYQLALKTIRTHTGTFAKACLLRLYWFWHIMPQGPDAGAMSRFIIVPVALFYLLENLLALIGIVRVWKRSWRTSVIFLVPIVTLVGVHLFFWTNMRMRASLLPILAVLVAAALWRKKQTPAVVAAID
jgi:4-amino-4-deoxy-L-arabinose transferase-like glycosyltransferase